MGPDGRPTCMRRWQRCAYSTRRGGPTRPTRAAAAAQSRPRFGWLRCCRRQWTSGGAGPEGPPTAAQQRPRMAAAVVAGRLRPTGWGLPASFGDWSRCRRACATPCASAWRTRAGRLATTGSSVSAAMAAAPIASWALVPRPRRQRALFPLGWPCRWCCISTLGRSGSGVRTKSWPWRWQRQNCRAARASTAPVSANACC
mmetsp:Transcript_31988/g.95547  ORF Transcript_31988/g.95547 Transcript_31988/m.95547 type:complete len:200 (+) Transcript_31988:412-1011(+)